MKTRGTEQRSFPRRKLEIDFDLIISGERIPAVITDYSLSGVGILVKGKSDLAEQILDLRASSANIAATGRVVWRREMFAGVRVGLLCSGPLEGRLISYGLPDIVTGIFRARKTGILTVGLDNWSRQVFFKEGEMVYAASDIPEEQIGAVLLSTDRITRPVYEKTLQIAQETGKNHGAVLVELKHLSPTQLVSAVHQRVETVIMNLCDVEDARFSFREEPLARGEIIVMKLNSADLLYRGYRRTRLLDSLRRTLFTPGAVLKPSVERERSLQRLSLDKPGLQVLALVDEDTTLADIISRSPFSEEETIRTLYALFNSCVVEIEAGKLPEAKADDLAPPQEPVRPADQELVEKVDALYRGLKDIGYHGVLGLQAQTPTAAELKRAYHAMAKEYHPDRYLQVDSAVLKEKLNVIFAYINEAYRELLKDSGQGEKTTARVPGARATAENSRSLAAGKYRQGREHLAAGNQEEAMMLFGQAVYMDDTEPDYHFFYGVALHRNKKIKDAEASIRKALQLSPYNAEYINELGFIYLKLGFKTRARNAFDKALSLDPGNRRALQGMKQTEEMKA